MQDYNEMEELIQELQETINSLTEENTKLQDAVDDLQKEFEEYEINTPNITKRLESLERQMEKLVNVRYHYNQNREILRFETSITREVLEQVGPDILDTAYSNMKNEFKRELMAAAHAKTHYFNGKSI